MSRSILKAVLVAACLTTLAAGPASAGGLFGNWKCSFCKKKKKSDPCDQKFDPDTCFDYGYCYPCIQASLYPCPQPHIPREVGQTLITNPALAPHEMLYPHCYKAIYPPYYYENKCCLSCLPFFPKPPLKGVEVTVKYHSHFTLCSGFKPPCRSKCVSNTQFK